MKSIILNYDFDIMGIVESGAASDNEEYFNTFGYQKFVLKQFKTNCFWHYYFVKLSLQGKLIASHQGTTEDKLEFMKIHL